MCISFVLSSQWSCQREFLVKLVIFVYIGKNISKFMWVYYDYTLLKNIFSRADNCCFYMHNFLLTAVTFSHFSFEYSSFSLNSQVHPLLLILCISSRSFTQIPPRPCCIYNDCSISNLCLFFCYFSVFIPFYKIQYIFLS